MRRTGKSFSSTDIFPHIFRVSILNTASWSSRIYIVIWEHTTPKSRTYFYHSVTVVHKTCFLYRKFITQLSKKKKKKVFGKTIQKNIPSRSRPTQRICQKIEVLNEPWALQGYLPQKETYWIPNGIPEFFYERHGPTTVLIKLKKWLVAAKR